VATPEQGNWIAGERRPAAAESWFERRSGRPPFAALGRWPRSEAADAVEALRTVAAGTAAWRALDRAERLDRLRRVPEALEARGDLCELLAAELGLGPNELRPRLERDLHGLREGLELAADAGTVEPPGAGLFAAHWSDLAGTLAARVLARLAGGAGVCVLADSALPSAADALGRALVEVLGPGPWAVLHADRRGALAGALAWPELAWARLRGCREALERALAPYAVVPPSWQLWPLVNASWVVPAGADPAAQAAAVVRKAVGRSSTLSGQCPGQVGRVYCHQKLFSRFQEELLALLEGSSDVRRPVPLVEDDLFEHVHRAWAMGLDEGATPLFGGAPARLPRAASGEAGRGEAAAARAPLAPLTLGPIVFTNVDPARDLAGLDRPAPVLGLARVASDEEGRELARRAPGGR